MRSASDDPDHLTPHERLLEIGAILAAGIHRLRAVVVPTAPVGPETPIPATGSGLEDCSTFRPDGSRCQRGLTQEE